MRLSAMKMASLRWTRSRRWLPPSAVSSHAILCGWRNEGEYMGAVKHVLATLGLFLFLCPGTAVHAQEKIATYPPFAPGYISIKVFDNQSRFVGRLLPERRYWVSIDQIPIFLQNALLAIEDSRFYEHGAIDLRGITRALVKDVIKRRMAEGGSTITQQLIKNKYFSGKKTFQRKVKEGLLALESVSYTHLRAHETVLD